MYLVIVLSAIVGAGIFFAGWCVGRWPDPAKKAGAAAKKARKPRVPKCYVIVPGEGAEPQHKRQKKTSTSGRGTSGEIDLEKIPGVDFRV